MTDGRRTRRDAVANRERLLAAATEAFREHGLSVDMRAVATAAGVGVGTVYRHFPTRDDLVRAVTGSDLTDLAATLPAGVSALDGLRAFFTRALGLIAENKAVIDLLAGGSPTDADLERCLAHLRTVGGEAVERSATDRTLAPDVTADDIAYQLLGLIRIAQLVSDPDSLRHQLDLVLRGLAA